MFQYQGKECPRPQLLSDYVVSIRTDKDYRRIDEQTRRVIFDHIAKCPRCAERVRQEHTRQDRHDMQQARIEADARV